MRRIAIAVAALMVAGLALPAAAAPDGKALFEHKCAMCHGQDGTPKKMAEGSLAFTSAEFKKDMNAAAIEKVITEGKEKMKPVKTLSPEEAKAVAEYVVSMPEKK
jgi:mono/diheme cytochrome c family protein